MEYLEKDIKTWIKTPKLGIIYVKIPGQDGKWKSSGTADRDEAIRWALAMARGEATSDITFGGFARNFFLRGQCQYVQTIEGENNLKTSKYLKDMRSLLTLHMIPKWGSWEMMGVTPALFHDWLLNLKGDRGQHLSASTKKKMRGVAIIIWDWAVFKGVLKYNSLRSLPKVMGSGKKRNKFTNGELVKMFPEELQDVWPQGRTMHSVLQPGWGHFMILLKETGCRPQEVCALSFEDYRPSSKTFIVKKAVGEDGQVKGLKTAKKGVSLRAVGISTALSCKIEEAIKAGASGLLFRKADGAPVRVDTASKVFNRVLDYYKPEGQVPWYPMLNPIGIDRQDRTLYSLRHTRNTQAVSDAARKVAQSLMGHTTNAMTDNYDDPDEADAIARIGR